MGYTKIAGMPVITGLYTILIPLALFALFGSSRHLVVGADSATAAIMAAGLAGLATAGSPEYVAYAGILALMAAALLILARLIKLGFLADFLSRTVLIGFLTGVGIQVAIGQISGMLGIPGGGAGPVQQLITDFQQLPQTNIYTLAVSIGVIATILICKRINKRIPGGLIAVIGAILISYFFNLSAYGVALLGPVPSGLPTLGFPTGETMNPAIFGQLLGVAISMFIVILAQSAATSRAYATRYNDKFSENVDLVGSGVSEYRRGLERHFRGVTAARPRPRCWQATAVAARLSSLATVAVVAIVLLFLTVPLSYMPEAVLSSVVFLIGVELVDALGMRQIFAQRPAEFWVALITALVVIFVGVEQGILLAIVLSILFHTRHGYKPKNELLEVDPAGRPHLAPVSSHAQAIPGLIIYRFHHSMYYANSEHFSEEVLELVNTAQPPVSWFCIDATSVDDIDFSAAATLPRNLQHAKGERSPAGDGRGRRRHPQRAGPL